MITITPPGADELPWDTAKCTHLPGVKCSGSRGCVVHERALGAWHADFAPRLDRLLRAARERLRRRGHKMPRLVAMTEPQGRGALHLHMATHLADRSATVLLYEALRELSPRYGFGAQVSLDLARGLDRQGRRQGGAGGYLAKIAGYMAKGASGELLEVLKALPGRRIFRASVRVTAQTRCTMRNLRSIRGLYRRSGVTYTPHEAERYLPIMRAVDEDRQREQTILARLELMANDLPPPLWRQGASRARAGLPPLPPSPADR